MNTIYGIRLPKILHYTLNNPGSRIIIVGDIHGCYDEFIELLNKCNYQPLDTLILVGDLCMKGPKTLEVLQFVVKNKILSVRGNVDENMLKNYELLKLQNSDNWHEYEFMKQLTDDEIQYIYELPYTISIPKINAIVVHAGLIPGKNLADQDLNDLIRMRNIIVENGVLIGSSDQNKGDAWITFWNEPQHVYFGHNAERKLQLSDFATGLDTACCYGFQLTAAVITDHTELIHVNSLHRYCHN